METDFIVVGSGLSGLTSSLILKDYGRVLLITKSKLNNCATNLAQGGIAAVVDSSDSFESHIKDTLEAGAYHSDKKAVKYLVSHAKEAIDWLVKQGVRFASDQNHFLPTREAAHSFPRVLHATDFTGREIETVLIEKVKKEKNITIWEDCYVLKLIVEEKRCFGIQMIKDKKNINCFSKATILATGGLGQLFECTTNPIVATGDGIALAVKAGAKVKDLEFIQFHPTALKPACRQAGHGVSPLFLLSEALRGEGAYLVRKDGKRFMEDYDNRGELAPRDIVARAIFAEQQKGYEVYLDMTHKKKEYLVQRFPNIYKELKKRGFDLGCDLIPVTPAAHYSCGGVETDLYGRTNIRNLFAFGEVAATGVHGANRLASNSLLEAVVFPLQLKDYQFFSTGKFLHHTPEKSSIRPVKAIREDLKRLMWENVGIVRTKEGLKRALHQIKKWERETFGSENMLLVARLIVQSAIKRKKSLGAHFIK